MNLKWIWDIEWAEFCIRVIKIQNNTSHMLHDLWLRARANWSTCHLIDNRICRRHLRIRLYDICTGYLNKII